MRVCAGVRMFDVVNREDVPCVLERREMLEYLYILSLSFFHYLTNVAFIMESRA